MKKLTEKQEYMLNEFKTIQRKHGIVSFEKFHKFDKRVSNKLLFSKLVQPVFRKYYDGSLDEHIGEIIGYKII